MIITICFDLELFDCVVEKRNTKVVLRDITMELGQPYIRRTQMKSENFARILITLVGQLCHTGQKWWTHHVARVEKIKFSFNVHLQVRDCIKYICLTIWSVYGQPDGHLIEDLMGGDLTSFSKKTQKFGHILMLTQKYNISSITLLSTSGLGLETKSTKIKFSHVNFSLICKIRRVRWKFVKHFRIENLVENRQRRAIRTELKINQTLITSRRFLCHQILFITWHLVQCHASVKKNKRRTTYNTYKI